MDLKTIISFVQILSAVIAIILVLLQERGGGMGEAIGGSSQGGFSSSRRGLEKNIFFGTIACVALFIGASVANLLL